MAIKRAGTSGFGGSWLGRVLLALVLIAVALAVGALVAFFVARSQIAGMDPTLQVVDATPPRPQQQELLPEIDLHFDLVSAQLLVRPVAAGEPFEIRSVHDPSHYRLDVTETEGTPGKRIDVIFRPASKMLAFLRMKAGERPPELLVLVPRDQPLRISGLLVTSFGAVEAGGLVLDSFSLEVEGGGATVSFLEPLARPMESFSMVGDKGSLEVTGLGNASPREVVVAHKLGELDIDLRGAWQRSATVDISVAFAGGSCWLPHDLEVRRDGGKDRVLDVAPAELRLAAPLAIDFTLEERGGRMLVFR